MMPLEFVVIVTREEVGKGCFFGLPPCDRGADVVGQLDSVPILPQSWESAPILGNVPRVTVLHTAQPGQLVVFVATEGKGDPILSLHHRVDPAAD